MLKDDIAIVSRNKDGNFMKLIHKRNICVKGAYVRRGVFFRNIKRICDVLSLSCVEIFYNKELKNMREKVIIVFDSLITYDFVLWLRKNNPQKKIILWYWNPVRNSINPYVIPDDICEKWSYSQSDCEKYGLNYDTTFYFKDLSVENCSYEIDILFVGKNKDRLGYILELKEEFESQDLKVYYHITKDSRFSIKNIKMYKPLIPYSQILSLIGKSKAILEILQHSDDGISLRAMESIFFQKKLITNSKEIMKHDFYHPENIFILGKDNLEDLKYFLNLPYKKIDENIIKSYEFEHWLNRLLKA